jgi:hypothetical protein
MRITPDELYDLDSGRFEMLVAGLLMEAGGFHNELALGGAGDEGVDLRAEWLENLPTGGQRQTVWAVQDKVLTAPPFWWRVPCEVDASSADPLG